MRQAYHKLRYRLELKKKVRELKASESNGIYYFLGNIPQHITHVLPLYSLIGGTVVVTSKAAADLLSAHNVRTLLIDEAPDLFLELDTKISKTINFLNDNAKVVLLYEIFTFDGIRFDVPTIMLSHGIAIKDYWTNHKIESLIQNYSFIATLGPFLKDLMKDRGVPNHMLIDVGLARNDLIIEKWARYSRKDFIRSLPNYRGQPIVCYMPTYWGASSVFDTGLEIINNISEEYYLLFKPHPQTPEETLSNYKHVIAAKNNLHYLSESEADLLSLYKYTDAVIGDLSSVVADVILAKKPIVFAYGGGGYQQDPSVYWPLREVHATSLRISPGEGECVNLILHATLNRRSSIGKYYRLTSNRLFFNLEGDSRQGLLQFMINELNL